MNRQNPYRIVFLTLYLIGILLFTTSCQTKKTELINLPIAVDGVLNLANWEFKNGEMVNLKGKWEFYRNELILPDELKRDNSIVKEFIDVPGNWMQKKRDGTYHSGYGVATYRLIVKLNHVGEKYGLKIPDINSAYTVWINGEKLGSLGGVAKTENLYFPQTKSQTVFFRADKEVLEIILQVANFKAHEQGCGIQTNILLGPQQYIINDVAWKTMVDAFIFGVLFIIGVYYMIFFFLMHRKDSGLLLFSLICFTTALRGVFSGEHVINYIFPQLYFEFVKKVEYLSMYIPLVLFVLLFRKLFPNETSKIIIRIVLVTTCIFSLITIVFPQIIYGKFLSFFQIYLLAVGVYLISCLVIATIKKRVVARVILISTSIVWIAILNDVLSAQMIINTPLLVGYGFVACIFAQAMILAKRFSDIYWQVDAYALELENMNQMKDEFLSNTSHELRTPLSGMIGLSQALLDGSFGGINEKQKTNLEMIIASGKRLASLIRDLLDYSRLKNKDISLQKKTIDIRQMVEIVLSILSQTVKGKDIDLINEISENISLIYADENRVQQILYNLIGNAVKFTEKGYVKVSASKKDAWIVICVEDTGIGISKDKFEDIFKSFEQIDGSIAREYEGTGIGLYVTKFLVELHGGFIEVDSEIEKGSVFKFSLPVATDKLVEQEFIATKKADQNAAFRKMHSKNLNSVVENLLTKDLQNNDKHHRNNEDKKDDISKNENKNLCILIVDDEPINIHLLSTQLLSENYKILIAFSGREANEILDKETNIDLAILDVMMPKMSGYELCRKIREKHSLFELPVIMLSAMSLTEDLEEGLRSGANDYLEKPFEKRELLARVKTLLSLKSGIYAKQELEDLKNKQRQIIESEKMMSLSRLVAGVAHEINTPMGICISAATFLETKTEELAQKYHGSKIKKSDMEKYLEDGKDAGKLMIGSLNRISENIKVFKQAAADRTTEQKKKFKVKDYINSVILPDQMIELKKLGHKIHIICSEELEICSYPSSLSLIITNFISNSIKHAFVDRAGVITIEVNMIGHKLSILYKDNGKGIPKEDITKMFDPFYTTKMSTGAGLGLYIVHNMVTQVLGGVISCSSEIGEGTIFTIEWNDEEND